MSTKKGEKESFRSFNRSHTVRCLGLLLHVICVKILHFAWENVYFLCRIQMSRNGPRTSPKGSQLCDCKSARTK